MAQRTAITRMATASATRTWWESCATSALRAITASNRVPAVSLADVPKALLATTVMTRASASANPGLLVRIVKLARRATGVTTSTAARVSTQSKCPPRRVKLIFNFFLSFSACKCNEKFSRATQCNLFTGQCQCLPGVIGEKCERCPDRWVLDPAAGCQECGNCVHVLLNDTDKLASLIGPIQNDIEDTSSSVLYYKKLNYIKGMYDNYTKLVNETFSDTPERTVRLEAFAKVKEDLNDLSNNINTLDFKVTYSKPI